ncbi:MAG: succinate dehydrogenase assembly factor 2 [Candidatus Liberibacter europaeus]|uniref:FAD assembly factor SdhE n=1 Tax=Candidatus Liberibacter europaeus TaxID=744859 RepID=A0A2T4VWG9_9HYPH|nr:succinate dehydrogenase assembly factor 2 [Candidatus Liberibacter europaeus]PTL86131.1 MAG: succinate dehydrogenase assembly factor 2 [Candidatus Liberibacter europaeus]
MRKNMNLRCRRIVYRCWRRGTREMDLILGSFVDKFILDLNENELDMLESIMNEDDTSLFKWITGMEEIPEYIRTSIFQKICSHYSFNYDK